MSSRLIGAFLAFVTACTLATPAEAATREDVARVLMFITRPDAYKKLMLKRPDVESNGLTVVFVEKGRRYSLYYVPPTTHTWGQSSGLLSVWVIPDDLAKRSADLEPTFSDDGLDGVVDFGVEGPTTWQEDWRKLFDSEKFAPKAAKGIQYAPYWQAKYDEAIADAIHHFYGK